MMRKLSFSRAMSVALTAMLAGLPAAAQTLELGAPALPSGGFSAPVAPAPPPTAPAAPTPPPGTVAAPAVPAKPKLKRVAAPPRQTAVETTGDPRPSLSAQTFEATARAYERYLAIYEKGGWPSLPGNAKLSKGAKGPNVALLRKRLATTDDIPAALAEGDVFDDAVLAGVKAFQQRHGLRQTGVVSGATLTALNVSAQTRFKQLAASARRLAQSQFPFGQRYVVVNIPAAIVEAVEGDRVARRFVAVVGKADRASPEVETRITSINFNPTWTVPPSIIKKDIIPKMRKDASYLKRANIRILRNGTEVNPGSIDWSSEAAANFTLRQDPGARNSLGSVRIDMPNKHAVYLHDTPSKSLFGSDNRFHSSGCVRVGDVRELVTWLLGPQGWNRARVDEAIADGERRDVRMQAAVPVIWIYLTAYATADGMVHFRDDVYEADRAPLAEIPKA